ncbi:MAG TPA: PIG-L family deacetylase [Gemmatimonadaceae bacterium]|jgi:LmbE family N-acetylglucosaminyl deacetylase|nr:PIG-L family deacetylase [Gemmatimonadaceae bacterium]
MSIAQLVSSASRVLVLCAHTDDEFGCSGTISRIVELGATVRYLALSDCVGSVPPGFPSDVLIHECFACTSRLGIPPERVTIEKFPVRHFPQYRQDILEMLVAVRKTYRPDLVLLPCSYDTHQDHRTVFEEGFRAFKLATILGYELPQNLTAFNHSAFVKLSPQQLEAKIHALSAYQSQEHRPYAVRSFIESLATVRGVQCGADYAEAFEVIRLILT